MNKQVKVVKLRSTGVRARILVLSQEEVQIIASSLVPHDVDDIDRVQTIYYFCQNMLQGVVPNLAGKPEEFRREVFEELYRCILEYNPELTKVAPAVHDFDLDEDEDSDTAETVFVFADWRSDEDTTPTRRAKSKKVPDKLSKVDKTSVRGITKSLSKAVFGQPKAVQLIQEYFEMSLSGLRDPAKTRGAFLFIGPSGVGKTLTAKELAKYFWKDRWKEGLFVINGSEFQQEHETAKLLGSPAGYVGFDEGSPLMKHVSKNPESIILIDEFEKAHPKLQDVFLQIIDEAECYDSRHNRIDFSKCFLVFTSNIGTKEVYHKNPIGFCERSQTNPEKSIKAALQESCRVEFLKRFDGIVVFEPLTNLSHTEIAKVELKKLSERLDTKKIKLSVGRGVVQRIVESVEEGDTGRDITNYVNTNVVSGASKLLIKDTDYNEIKVSIKGGEIRVRGVRVNGEEDEVPS